MGRFIQEAKAASALNHPNVLTVHEIGETNDTNYIVNLSRLKVDPMMDPLRDDPRFKEMLKRLNLPE